ncbi:MAG: sensor histidine kinase [Treponema sp.]
MIADLTQNSVEADATLVTLDFVQTEDTLTVTLVDNGKGMSEETLARAKDPFYTDGKKHPGRKIGLGIPFLIQTMQETDGDWNIKSAVGKGTTVFMQFNLANIDTPPIGKISEMFAEVMTLPGTKNGYDMDIHRTNINPVLDYRLNRNEIKEALGGDLESVESIKLLNEYIESQEQPQ